MSAHTPGPWKWMAQGAGPEDEWGCRTPGEIDPRTFVSTGYCYNPELIGANGETVISAGAGEYTPFQNPADAVAISAAPDLLAALRGLVGAVEQFTHATDDDWPELAAAKAALTKAEGRP